jgi:RHS repeat-associated protein
VGTTAQGSTGWTCLNSGSGATGDLLNLAIQYGAAGADNGNVTSETIQNASGINVTQTFTPDAYNRLRTMTENTVTQTYGYDQFGNRAVTGGYVPSQNLTPQSVSGYATATNHWTGFQYEAMGNVTFDGLNTSIYDDENRLYTSSQTLSNVTTTMQYTYDPEGRRVQVQQTGGSGQNTVYVHDAGGALVAEYSNTRVVDPNTTQYLSADHLGSTRLVTGVGPSVSRCYDYLPFGEEMTSGVDGRTGCYETGTQTTVPGVTSIKFTGKERDAETGLDYFGARYNSSSMGRFMSPDPLGGSLADPQSLNRYAYVLNNPLRFTDPTGMYVCKDSTDCSSKADKAFEKALAGLRGSSNADIARAAGAYGAANKDNGVNVGFADLTKKGENGSTVSTIGTDASGNLRANSAVTINSKISGDDLAATVGHKGSHAADAQDVVRSGLTEDGPAIHAGMNIAPYQSEQRAYGVSSAILSQENQSRKYDCGMTPCTLGVGAGMQSQLPGVIDQIVSHDAIYNQGGQPMGPTNQGPSVVNGVTPKASVPH